jgi:hypothetical protein
MAPFGCYHEAKVILIELVYEAGCPKVAVVRANLGWALLEARVSQRWTEWMRPAEGLPARARGCPSPTILINGRPVEASDPLDASTRYTTVPSVSTIAKALVAARKADPDIPAHRMRAPGKRRRRATMK